LSDHYDLLCRWNKVLNLTTIERLEEAVERHYCESLFLAGHLPESGSFVDIGSGAGFPGFVVAAARPNCSVTLVESHQRKAVFLREASRKLPNVRVRAVRAESITESFDWLISRPFRIRIFRASFPGSRRGLLCFPEAKNRPRLGPFVGKPSHFRMGNSAFSGSANCFT